MSIPASKFVTIIPGVVSAGGTALDLNGLFLTENTRVPIGAVLSLAPTVVKDYFGSTSDEAMAANVYGKGFTGCTRYPAAMLFARYPGSTGNGVSAWLRGGNIGGLGIGYLQAITSGTLILTIDGYTHTAAALDFSTCNSQSDAAAVITSAISGSTAASFTATIATTTLTVSAVAHGTLAVGQLVQGTGVTAGTVISALGTGTGATGTYILSQSSTVSTGEAMTTLSDPSAAVFTATCSTTTLTVSAVAHGTLAVGQAITGAGVSSGTRIVALGTGTGATGTYILNNSSTVGTGETMTAVALQPTVAYDSVSGGFLITSALTGTTSTAAYATGTLADTLLLTLASGAVLSQGAAATTPTAFMDSIIQLSQNWATLVTLFNPDVSGNTNKLGFAAWIDAQTNRYAYACWDTDQSPVSTAPALGSAGYLINQYNNYSGTILVSEGSAGESTWHHAAFIAGFGAALDFQAHEGRATLAFKGQSGLTASVSTLQAAQNLESNGYNYYGAVATANDNFVFMYPGSISGPFLWADSFFNQVWLNNALQLAILELFVNVKSIPYNDAGYALIEAACMDPIKTAVNFGAIRAGVTLSSAQIAEINSVAGKAIDQTLSQRGWYLQIVDASPQIRAARQSPECTLWYMDGQSVQQLTLSSLNVQ